MNKDVNIDIDKIRLVFFDFDETLAVHNDSKFREHRKESEEKYIEYYKDAYLFPWNFYTDIEPCSPDPSMYRLVHEFLRRQVKMFCLTGMKMSLHKKAKEMFIMKNYCDDIEVVSAYPQENKVLAVRCLAEAYGVSDPHEILVVDDDSAVLDSMEKEGYNVLIPQEVEVWMEDP